MKVYDDKFKKIHGYEEGKAEAIDKLSAEKALGYKKQFLKNFVSINQTQIADRLGGEKYYVTRKYDGEYAIIIYDNGETVTVNRSGRVRRGIPCIEEAGKLIAKAGYKQAIIPAEIYVEDPNRKTRVNDLIHALAKKDKIGSLRLAAFDVLELDSKPFRSLNFGETWKVLVDVFSKGKLVHPVDMEVADNSREVSGLFTRWVEQEGSEGLVVHSDLPVVYKVKSRHNIDVVVIGYSEGTGVEQGQVRSLLTALIPEEGRYQVIGRVGSGLRETLRKELFKEFSRRKLRSDYIETDTNYVAFQMVEPYMVIEVSINDLLIDTAYGRKQNSIIFVGDGEYKYLNHIDGFKFLAPVFERVRDDKKADAFDVRPSQIDDFYYREHTTDLPEAAEAEPLPQSELLLRETYRKQLGGKLMIQKYLLWKTNKEQSGDWPAYVLHYTNFSSGRQEPLQKELRVSDNHEQIMELLQQYRDANVKQGWQQVDSMEFPRPKDKDRKPKKAAAISLPDEELEEEIV